MLATATQNQPQAEALAESRVSCPHCLSARVHRSHRRTLADRLFSALGAEIRRCHDCRTRRAYWGCLSVSVGRADAPSNVLMYLGVLLSAFAGSVLCLWLFITRFTGA